MCSIPRKLLPCSGKSNGCEPIMTARLLSRMIDPQQPVPFSANRVLNPYNSFSLTFDGQSAALRNKEVFKSTCADVSIHSFSVIIHSLINTFARLQYENRYHMHRSFGLRHPNRMDRIRRALHSRIHK